jgi:prepilin-type N-terminal cleavage/methylation domain-containing protein
MKIHLTSPSVRRPGERALTLLEMMVAMSLLLIIVLGLYAMFDQTQKAFRGSLTQTDVLESQRAAIDIMVRELEQSRPLPAAIGCTNFYTEVNPFASYPLQLPLNGGTNFSTEINSFFFLNTYQSNWTGIAYLIAPTSTNASDQTLFQNGVGTLYRYSVTTNGPVRNATNLLDGFIYSSFSDYQRVADGAVHLRMRAYQSDGYTNTAFTGTLLPVYVDLELAILEPRVVEQARAIPNAQAMQAFLRDIKQASKVHLFRQHIPIQTASQ